MTDVSQVPGATPDGRQELLAQFADLVPSAFPDGVLDTGLLLEALDAKGQERPSFSFAWPGIDVARADARAATAALVPDPGKTEEQNPPQPRPGFDPKNGVVAAPEGGTNLFDHVIYDSQVERDFAAQLENFSDKLFTELPRRFRVRTPVGEYSTDWAIVYDDNGTEGLYLVRETKGTTNLDDLDWDEAMRIRFTRRHFEKAPAGAVDYYFTTAEAGLRVDADWSDGQGGAE